VRAFEPAKGILLLAERVGRLDLQGTSRQIGDEGCLVAAPFIKDTVAGTK
jgi:hypothetical protein